MWYAYDGRGQILRPFFQSESYDEVVDYVKFKFKTEKVPKFVELTTHEWHWKSKLCNPTLPTRCQRW
jgi:hypothetical protein